MKSRKLIAGVIIFIICSVGNVYLSSVAHGLLSHEANLGHIGTFGENVRVIVSNHNARAIYLSVEIFVLLAVILSSVTRVQSYKSEMINITEDIVIPKSVGQNQYGSARFYRKDELDKFFTPIKINKSDNAIRELMAHGYDDLKEGM